jgi:hypothetical protein
MDININIGEMPAGRLKMELFSDIVPKYVALVLRICTHHLLSFLSFQDCREFPLAVLRRVQG